MSRLVCKVWGLHTRRYLVADRYSDCAGGANSSIMYLQRPFSTFISSTIQCQLGPQYIHGLAWEDIVNRRVV